MQRNICKCKCGASVDVDFGGCTEFYGRTWQDARLGCNEKCGYSVDITFNADFDGQGELAKKLVIEAWNKLIHGAK